MRLIKLSTDEFPEERDLQRYFGETLPARKPPGRFFFGNQIGEQGLEVGETLLFCYRGSIRYVAKAETTRMDSPPEKRDNYPHYFVINLTSLRRTDIPLADLERQLQLKVGLKKSLQGRAWTRIPDSDGAETAINELLKT